MRRSDSGTGRLKAILVMAAFVLLGYVCVKVVPPYVQNYELTDYLRQVAIQATVEHSTPDRIRDAVLAKAHDLNLPVTPEQVMVNIGTRVEIQLNYYVPINLKVYSFYLHFTPSASNTQI